LENSAGAQSLVDSGEVLGFVKLVGRSTFWVHTHFYLKDEGSSKTKLYAVVIRIMSQSNQKMFNIRRRKSKQANKQTLASASA
jgi:hypothetical protein